MNKSIKPPSLSTSFSESGKNAKKRFDNILDLSKKKKGLLGFSFILLAIIIISVIVSYGKKNDVSYEYTDTINADGIAVIKDKMPDENYSAVLMNINTKDVIAQISNPENRIGIAAYEPGSAFSIITLAIALSENVVSLNDEYICNGSINVSGHNIPCLEKEGHGSQTIMQGMADSCYPMVAYMAEKIGKEKFYNYMKELGIADDNINGAVFHQKKNFNELELAISSIGQGFSATPLQIAKAFSIVLNGEDNIISKATSAQIIDVLTKSADITDANNTKVGMMNSVSEKLPRGVGKYVYSTIAIAPLDNPRVICVSVLDEPKNQKDSATVAFEVIKESFINSK